jgi:predicted N-acyltransferase
MSASSQRLRIVRDVEQIPQALWQSLVVGRPALRLEVLGAIAKAASRPMSLQFFLLEDEHGLAAAAVCELLAAPALYNPFDALLLGRASRIARRLGVSTQPLLLFKPPLARQAPIVLRSGDLAQQTLALASLLDGIEEHAAGGNLGIAFIGFTADDEFICSALRARRYLDSEIDTIAQLEVQWTDFDSYVDWLRTRSRNAAKIARNERNRNRRNGVSIRQLRPDPTDMQALYAITYEHHRHKSGRDLPFGPEFLPNLATALGDDLLIFEALRDGRPVGSLWVVRSGFVGWVAYVGIELRDRPNDFTYANLLFYHAADWAPALGLKTLLYGTSVQQAKQMRGCRLIACQLFYRPHGRFTRLFAAPYLLLHQLVFRRKQRRLSIRVRDAVP